MDQHTGKAAANEAAATVQDTLGDLAAKSEKVVQQGIDQAKPALRNLQEYVGGAMDKATDMAQKASSAGVQAVDAVQGVARDVANQTTQAVTAAYEKGARAGGSVSRYAAEQPLTALLIAAAIGYGVAYLIHRS
jgi:ElaB/YqjD/DUF883 family membrane-anchored ribosome-binding protein